MTTTTTLKPARNYIVMGGDVSPGKAIVKDAHSPRGWDVRKGYATTGATLVPTGDDPWPFAVRFELWEEAHFPAWYAFAAKYFDRSVRLLPGSTVPKALGIYHPILAAPPLRIAQCVVADATQLEADEFGLWSCEVSFLEYKRPKPALSAPSAVIPAAAQPQPTAEDAADQQIAQLLQQLQGLAQ